MCENFVLLILVMSQNAFNLREEGGGATKTYANFTRSLKFP